MTDEILHAGDKAFGGKTVFDADYDIDDDGLPQEKAVLGKK